jgi:hypothetical protein
LSLNDLSSRLGIRIARLREIERDIKSHYKIRPLDEKNKDKVRMLTIPDHELKDIQRRIKKNILDPISLAEAAQGGVRGRSPRSNASKHLGKPCVVSLDVKEFYPSVRHRMVYRMFRHELRFGRDVASLLTRLTTFDAELPQGAPTSTGVGNILLALPVDGPISAEAEQMEVSNTRFVDDITLSGSNPRPLINMVGRMLSRRGLRMHRKKAKGKSKLKIASRTEPQEVTGLLVNSRNGPSVARKRRDKVRAAIFRLRAQTDEIARGAEERSIRGRIDYVRQFNPGAARYLQKYLELTLGRSQ